MFLLPRNFVISTFRLSLPTEYPYTFFLMNHHGTDLFAQAVHRPASNCTHNHVPHLHSVAYLKRNQVPDVSARDRQIGLSLDTLACLVYDGLGPGWTLQVLDFSYGGGRGCVSGSLVFAVFLLECVAYGAFLVRCFIPHSWSLTLIGRERGFIYRCSLARE